MNRLGAGALALAGALACAAPVQAQNSWPTAGGAGVSGYVAMCLDGTGKAVPALASGTCLGSGGGALSGNFTAGNLVVGGPGATQAQDSAAVSNMNAPVGINFSSDIAYAGASGANNSWLYTQKNISGTPTNGIDGLVSPLHFLIAHDTATPAVNIYGLAVKIQPDTGHKGGRAALLGYMQVVGVPGAGSVNLEYVGIQGLATTAQNLGGTTGTLSNYAGALFGGNTNVFLGSGATFLKLVTAFEFDISIGAGSSVGRKEGLLIVQTATDVGRGAFEDAAIVITNQDSSATTWQNGLLFGSYSSKWAFGADSTLIGAMQRVLPAPDSPIALNGVDFTAVTFQSGGAAFKSSGFKIDPNGNALHTGTTAPTLAAGTVAIAGLVAAPTFAANGEAALYTTTAGGAVLQGQGSTNDFTLANKNGTAILTVATGTQAATFSSSITAASLVATAINSATQQNFFRNSSAGATAALQVALGNNTTSTQVTMTLNSSANSGGNGASSFTVNSAGAMFLQGGGVNAIGITAAGVPQLPNVATGTPVASVCLDSGGNIIKKTTSGACL